MDYWSQYYIDRARERLEPSSFARWCAAEGWVAPADRVVDAGCGDGRDAIFFAGLGARVVAVDAAESAVKRCVALGLCAACASMGSLPKPDELLPPGTWHEASCSEVAGRLVVYSRFSLHAIDAKEAEAFLAWCRLHADVLLIETRSVNDPRYGRGDDAGDGAFVDTHYRRFTRLSDLTTELQALGFVVEHASEDWKAARTAYDAAVVNRVIVRRP
jgi:SAM-dependent methyltransferase